MEDLQHSTAKIANALILSALAQTIEVTLRSALRCHGADPEQDSAQIREQAEQAVCRVNPIRHRDAVRQTRLQIQGMVTDAMAIALELDLDHSAVHLIRAALERMATALLSGDPARRLVEVYEAALVPAKAPVQAPVSTLICRRCRTPLYEDDDARLSQRRTQAPEPDGYDAWFHDLAIVAENGLPALQAAWKASTLEYKEYLQQTDPVLWNFLKIKAAKAKVVTT